MAVESSIGLTPRFRFVHEPLEAVRGEPADRFVGRGEALEALVDRIVYSDGGSFLISGYRGVGKSTFVKHVVAAASERIEARPRATSVAQERQRGRDRLIAIELSCARPMGAQELMHFMLRSLYQQLIDLGIYELLNQSLRLDLQLAVARTSLSLELSRSREVTNGFGLGLPVIPDLSLDVRDSKKEGEVAAYLEYDDRAAEYDLIRIARRLRRGYVPRKSFWARLSRRSAPPIGLRLLVVLDELDKVGIEPLDGGKSPLDSILESLKGLLTTSGMTFLFVGGRDLYDRWTEDVQRGDSIYESIFTYTKYVPVLWDGLDELCDLLVEETPVDESDAAVFAKFKKYVGYVGRGLPRRIFRELNSYVRWRGHRPYLEFGRTDVRRFEFYAGLYDLLEAHSKEWFGGRIQEHRRDQARLSLFYLNDWIFYQGDLAFTLEDAVAASSHLNRLIAPTEDAAPELVRDLVDLLVHANYLEEVRLDPATDVVGLGVKDDREVVRYRVAPRRLVEMGLGREDEVLLPGAIYRANRQKSEGRYEIIGEVGRGGMATVFRAVDSRTGQVVAIKELHEFMHEDGTVRDRFLQEGATLRRLNHHNIVRVFDVDVGDERCRIVMELIDGPSLKQLIENGAIRSEHLALGCARQILEATEYCHQKGVIWRDPKPSNVLVTRTGRAVIIDFGIAHVEGSSVDTATGLAIGTPLYMSPEQVAGRPVDRRSDVYSLGIMLYEMLYGRAPFAGNPVHKIMMMHMGEDPDFPETPAVSDHILRVLRRSLTKDPQDRFPSVAAMLEALDAPSGTEGIAGVVKVVLEEERLIEEEAAAITAAIPAIPVQPLRSASPTPTATPSATASTSPGLRRRLPDGNTEWIPLPLPIQLNPDSTIIGGVVSLGRSPHSDVVLRDEAASRYHARIALSGDVHVVEDLNSANGTRVNGQLIDARHILSDGDVITIGTEEFVYVGGS